MLKIVAHMGLNNMTRPIAELANLPSNDIASFSVQQTACYQATLNDAMEFTMTTSPPNASECSKKSIQFVFPVVEPHSHTKFKLFSEWMTP